MEFGYASLVQNLLPARLKLKPTIFAGYKSGD